jgi:hypothetical protein
MKSVLVAACLIATVALVAALALPSSAEDQDYSQLLASLAASKLTLADGLAYVRRPAVPISAKFELADTPDHKLSLSVYVAERGLRVDVKHNRLDELAGDPTTRPWKPSVSPLVGGDLSDGVEQLAVAAKARASLMDLYKKAMADSGGRVIAIRSSFHGGKRGFAVEVVRLGAVSVLLYDINGARLAKQDD